MSGTDYREDDEIMETFVQEMLNRLEEMEMGLDALRPGVAPDMEEVDGVFRAAHSLKASANLLRFKNIEAITHGLETILDAMRWGKLVPVDQTLHTLIRGLDNLHHLLEDLENSDTFDVSTLLADFERATSATN